MSAYGDKCIEIAAVLQWGVERGDIQIDSVPTLGEMLAELEEIKRGRASYDAI